MKSKDLYQYKQEVDWNFYIQFAIFIQKNTYAISEK